MTTATNLAIVIEHGGLVVACAWCLSPAQIANLNRLYRVSHSLCPDCLAHLVATS